MPPGNDLSIHDDTLTFEMVDRDGAIAEAAEELAGHSRADFLRRAGEVRAFARKVARDEATHVAALRKALGGQAQASPRFDFQGTTRSRAKFLRTSYDLENTGVAA